MEKKLDILSQYNIFNQIKFNFVFKFLTVLINFFLVRELIQYLGADLYGIYLALISLYSIMFFFDFGLAKGARNFITEFYVERNYKSLRKIISSVYIFIFIFVFFTFFLFLLVSKSIFLLAFNNIRDYPNIYFLFVILAGSFLFRFVLGTIEQILYAIHKSHVVLGLNFISVLMYLIFLIFLDVLNFTNYDKLATTIYMYVFSFLLPYTIFSSYFFYKNEIFRPTFSYFSIKIIKNIFPIGINIVLIQIINLLIIGLDKILLINYGTNIDVVKYEVVFKIFSILFFLSSIITTPLWSAFNNAYVEKNFQFIRNVFKNSFKIIPIIFFIIFILSLFGNKLIQLWTGKFLNIGFFSIFLSGIVMFFLIYVNLFNDFFLGINKLKYPLLFGIISVIVKYSLLLGSIYFYTYLSFRTIAIINFLTYVVYLGYPLLLQKLMEINRKK